MPAEKAVEGSTEGDNHDNRGPAPPPPPHPLLGCCRPLQQGGVADCREDCRAGRRHEAKLELGWWEYLGSVKSVSASAQQTQSQYYRRAWSEVKANTRVRYKRSTVGK